MSVLSDPFDAGPGVARRPGVLDTGQDWPAAMRLPCPLTIPRVGSERLPPSLVVAS